MHDGLSEKRWEKCPGPTPWDHLAAAEQRARCHRTCDGTLTAVRARSYSPNTQRLNENDTLSAVAARSRPLQVGRRSPKFRSGPFPGFGTASLEMVERPHVWNDRIVESIDLKGGHLRRRVAREIVIPSSESTSGKRNGPQTYFIPLFRRRKGILLDNFDLDEPNEGAATLSFRQSRRFGSAILLLALEEEVRRKPPARRNPTIELLLLGIPFLAETAARGRHQRLFEQPNETSYEQDSFEQWLQENVRLRELSQFLVRHYFVVAQVEACPGQRVSVRYSYDSGASQGGGRSPSQRLSFRAVQQALGQRPTSFVFGIPNAFDSNSYHLRMSAPPGHYADRLVLYRASAVQENSSRVRSLLFDSASEGVMCLGLDRHSTSFIHVYLRGMGGRDRFPFYFHCNFYELPPSIALNAGVVFGLADDSTPNYCRRA